MTFRHSSIIMLLLLFSSIFHTSGMPWWSALGSHEVGSRTGLSGHAGAPAAGYRPEYLYLAAHVVIDHLADEHDAVVTGMRGLKALEGGVVRLYSVVGSRACVEGIAG